MECVPVFVLDLVGAGGGEHTSIAGAVGWPLVSLDGFSSVARSPGK